MSPDNESFFSRYTHDRSTGFCSLTLFITEYLHVSEYYSVRQTIAKSFWTSVSTSLAEHNNFGYRSFHSSINVGPAVEDPRPDEGKQA